MSLLLFLLVAILSLLSSPFSSAKKCDPPIDADVAALLEAIPFLVEIVTSWNATNNTVACCWDGVQCSEINGIKRVTGIELTKRTVVSGVIPEANLSFGLPPSFGNLTALEDLDLSVNRFKGNLPESWGSLKNLTGLDLSKNILTGNIPESWGNLTELETFSLSGNSLTGNLSENWKTLTKLTELDLSENSLTGNLPESWGSLTKLTTLDLSKNRLMGNVPESWGNLIKLEIFSLSGNNLTGNLPENWRKLTKLTELDLSENSLTGNLPKRWKNLKGMESLDLSKNRLTGNIPESWGNLIELTSLYLNGNNLTGNLSENWRKLTKLEELDLSENQLTGNLPESWGNFKALASLDLSFNSLTGNLPESWRNLINLISIGLNYNSLTGNPPESWRNLTKLESLDLSANNLTGNLPNSWRNLTELQSLDLSNNSLTGNLPESWGSLTKLTSLELNDNILTGVLPKSWGKLKKLKSLDLSNNNLTENLPESWGKLTELTYLNLKKNFLTGNLLEIWHNGFLSNIIEIDLSENMLSGGIPFSLLNASDLYGLYLRGNQFDSFSGAIDDLGVSLTLRHLDVGNNFLKEIPEGISKYTRLQKLYLDNNNITGAVPPFLGNFSFLKILDLSNNLFNSEIPVTFGAGGDVYDDSLYLFISSTFSSLSYLNLSRCNLTGEISENFGTLEKLSTLDLSYNQLTGNIPELQNSNLAALDLSSNKLSGELPPSLGGLKLTFLNLSMNNLTGLVPDYYFENNLANCTSFIPGNYLDAYCNYMSGFLVNKRLRSGLPRYATPIIVVGSVLLLFLAAFATYLCLFKKKKENSITKSINEHTVKFLPLLVISEATDNFSESNALGEGGFGKVYKGIAKNGELWAVKRAKTTSVESLELFKNEVETISRMNHKNLVKLIGFCHTDSEQILVYEFIENGTLRSALRQTEGKLQSVLTFEQRLDIALGAAEGLRYLHTQAKPNIIHRDVKSDNIMLDGHMQAKVCDFGLLKHNEDQGEPSGRTAVAGTYGYMDPEYYTTYLVTAKSDVYSFGVVILELITGKSALFVDMEASEEGEGSSTGEITSLASWALKRMRTVLLLSAIVDPSLDSIYPLEAMETLGNIAASCLQRVSKYRPDMALVASQLRVLKSKLEEGENQHKEYNVLPIEPNLELGEKYAYPSIIKGSMSEISTVIQPVPKDSFLVAR